MTTVLRLLTVAALGLALWGLAGCGPKCSPANCTGCCDATGQCQTPSAAQCGANGLACQACNAAQTCVQGICTFPGGIGTGNANGGGNTGNSSGSTG
jgi:hypothetical protein